MMPVCYPWQCENENESLKKSEEDTLSDLNQREAMLLLEVLDFPHPTPAQIEEAQKMVRDLQREGITYRNILEVLSGTSTESFVIRNYLIIKRKQLNEKE